MPTRDEANERLEAQYEELRRCLPLCDDVFRDADWLKQELIQAHAVYTRDASYALDGLRQALDAAIGYIEASVDWNHIETDVLLLPLRHHSRTLEALDKGVVEPILKPAPRGSGAPSLSIMEVEFRFFVGLAVWAQAKHVGLGNACSFVAGELDKRGFKRRRLREGHFEEITETTVRKWRDDLKNNWSKIHVAKGLTWAQYVNGFVCQAAAGSVPHREGQEPLAQALLRAIPRYFGHLAI
jgi:hypothetical protein